MNTTYDNIAVQAVDPDVPILVAQIVTSTTVCESQTVGKIWRRREEDRFFWDTDDSGDGYFASDFFDSYQECAEDARRKLTAD